MSDNNKNVFRNNARNWLARQYDIDAFWRSHPTEHADFQYMVYQIEECASSGAWYAQIYMQFKNCVRGSTVEGLVGQNALITVAYRPSGARSFCMKESGRVTAPVEYGLWKQEWQSERPEKDSSDVDVLSIKEVYFRLSDARSRESDVIDEILSLERVLRKLKSSDNNNNNNNNNSSNNNMSNNNNTRFE